MRSRVFVALVLLSASALTGLPASAGPGGIPAGPGGRATSNVRLLTNLPTGTGVGGDFLGSTYFMTSADTVWFTSPTGSYGATGGLLALDVSNPESPVVAGALALPHHQNEDLSLNARRQLAVISQQGLGPRCLGCGSR